MPTTRKQPVELSSLSGVLILYNEPSERRVSETRSTESEAGVLEEVKALSQALEKLDVHQRRAGVRGLQAISRILAGTTEPVVFNLVESLDGGPEQANCVPALCSAFGKSTTGSDTACLALTLDKWRTKAVLNAAGLPVPAGIPVLPGEDFQAAGLPPGKYIVKPCCTDASEGINGTPVFDTADPALSKAISCIHSQFNAPALVEQFVGNREFNVSIVEDAGTPRVLPIAEIDFSTFGDSRARIVNYEAKWLPNTFEFRNTPRIVPARLGRNIAAQMKGIALRAWKTACCRDYARVDMRMNEDGVMFVLEINANPDISPDAGFAATLQAAGIAYEEFVETILCNALERHRIETSLTGPASGHEDRPLDITVRRTETADREDIVRHIEATGFFRPDEVVIARAVLDEALAAGPEGHYQSFTADVDGRPVGWICLGATPCTENTFDIYWVVVDPAMQGKGIAKALMKHAHDLIADRGGRRIIIETSAQSRYYPTRAFYLKLGYVEEARVQNFYADGDDKIIYVKRLPAEHANEAW